MNKLIIASVAVLSLASMSPSFAQDAGVVDADAGAAIGATGGGVGGAAIGAVLGGPIGAIIGGFAGAVIGAEAGIETSTIDFASANPVDQIYVDGDLTVGSALPETVTVYPVQGDANYGYVYANGRVWIVDVNNRTLVQSPGYVVSQSTTDYVIGNPVTSAQVDGDVVVGYVLPETVEVTPVPDSGFGYVYLNDRPALIDNSNRTVVWFN